VIDASVILCVRNGARTIAAQLEALAAQECPYEWELVVVDNGSTDETAEIVERWRGRIPALRVVPALERAGLAYARNVGAAAAAGEVLAFCDADDVADPGWLAGLIAGARQADLVGGRLELELLNDPMTRHWRAMSEDDLGRPSALGYLHYAIGANFAVRRSVYEEVGGADEAFVACGDDVDLSWRIQRHGGSLVFRSDAVMHYRLRPDLRGFVRQRYLYGEVEGLLRRRFAEAIPPVRWADRGPGYGSLLIRVWHLVADEGRRGVWLGVAGYCAGRIRGAFRYRVLQY
jgi:glycosyltransferase involved in cell wall biosynthesis